MILAHKNSNAHLASTWTLGIALVTLSIGLYGVTQPLTPQLNKLVIVQNNDVTVLIEEFNPPPTPSAAVKLSPQKPLEPVQEVEIPPLPVIETLLTPAEMVELTPLEPISESPPLKIETVKQEDSSIPRLVMQRPSANNSGNENTSMGAGSNGAPTLFSGNGKSGRFSSPSYPALARSEGLQGEVRLYVVVEPSGLPSSVSIQSSSGSSSLDNAASDHVSRRWRWPAGDVRRYIVPIRFVLQ